jgi:hypothetical protein
MIEGKAGTERSDLHPTKQYNKSSHIHSSSTFAVISLEAIISHNQRNRGLQQQDRAQRRPDRPSMSAAFVHLHDIPLLFTMKLDYDDSCPRQGHKDLRTSSAILIPKTQSRALKSRVK